MKTVITAQQLTALGLPKQVQTFLRNRVPTNHIYDLSITGINGNWKTSCSRDGDLIDLLDWQEASLEELFAGCLPDLTMSDLLEMAQDRGEFSEALNELSTAPAEPIDQLWQWTKSRI